MAGTRKGATPHLHDPEAHVRAVEEDLEYWRTKRFEPRVITMSRRGAITFYDLLKSARRLRWRKRKSPRELEARIRALEDALDDYVKTIGLASSVRVPGAELVIEDTRKERGDYDEFFRIAKRSHRGTLAERIARLERELDEAGMLVAAYVGALIAKGFIRRTEYEKRRRSLDRQGEWNGARIVARAWADAEFKASLIARGREAVRELGIPPGRLGKLGVVENTERVHNVVVCTLCSCYPHDLLGDTPWWYKHDSYKQRIIRDPRGTLKEMFGLELPAGMEIRVHDSTSDVRYMVLPRRPPGTEGLSEEELARLVTRDSLIGVAEPLGVERLKK